MEIANLIDVSLGRNSQAIDFGDGQKLVHTPGALLPALDPQQRWLLWLLRLFHESEIIIGTLLELMRSYGIPCFSVHDSIIVKKKDQQVAMENLESQVLGRTTIEPRLKVK